VGRFVQTFKIKNYYTLHLEKLLSTSCPVSVRDNIEVGVVFRAHWRLRFRKEE
jgi:hypothetical protein